MSEEKNIEESPQDGKTESQKVEVNESISPPEAIEQTETQIKTSGITTSEIKEMEVHHPHHVTHKKKISEYILEFLMLFLAVFLGFIAENIRESSGEHNREKEFMKSMVEDLKADTANINSYYLHSDTVISEIDSLIHLIRKPDRDKYGQTMYYFARVITTGGGRIVLSDRTYEEMKSSGSLRLINDNALSDSISKYYALQTNFKEQEQLQLQKMNAYSDFVVKIFDGSIFQQMLQRYPYKVIPVNFNPPLLTNDKTTIDEFTGVLHYYSAIIIINSSRAKQEEPSTTSLIKMIQKKYHFQ